MGGEKQQNDRDGNEGDTIGGTQKNVTCTNQGTRRKNKEIHAFRKQKRKKGLKEE